jgi:hypothetical protein
MAKNVPERPSWSRPPFERGNTAGQRHGAHSDRALDPIAREIRDELLESGPDYLAEPSYAPAVAALARSEAQIVLLARWIEERGLLDEGGAPRGAVDLLLRVERAAQNLRNALGLTPLAREKLGRDVAGTKFDLARAMMAEATEDDE